MDNQPDPGSSSPVDDSPADSPPEPNTNLQPDVTPPPILPVQNMPDNAPPTPPPADDQPDFTPPSPPLPPMDDQPDVSSPPPPPADDQSMPPANNQIPSQPGVSYGTLQNNSSKKKSFGQYIADYYKKYVSFTGRARRKEYWYPVLFICLVGVVIGFISTIFKAGVLGQIIYDVFIVLNILPIISVTVRRLHDIDKSGWWIFIDFIPIIGAIWLFIYLVIKGTTGENKYGPDSITD